LNIKKIACEKLVTLTACCIVALCGCEKKTCAKHDSAVIVKVNGASLTVDRVEDVVRVHTQLAKETVRDRLAKNLRKTIVDKFIADSLLAEYARTNGVNLAKVEKDADAKLDAILKKNKRVKMSEADRLVLRGEIYTELANVAIIEDYLGKSGLKVSPNEVEERRRILTRYNERMVATNALVYAQASNAWSQVVAGKLSFHDAVLKYDESEDPTEDRDLWGSFSMGELASEPAVRAVVQRMKVGDVSPPVEGDNGLVIVKLLAVEEGTRQVSVEKSYRLGRIFFHLYEVWNDEGDKELEQDLLNIHRKELVSDLMRRLRDSATITYPKKKGE